MIGPLSYIGGKRAIAKPIIALFPEHTTYVEAFAGGAQVFFRKEPSEVEVLNDLDGEIVNFYRVCQQHYEELIRYFRFMVLSRAWHGLLKTTDPAALTDIQRAARYLYLLKNSFGGLVRNLNYHWNVTQPPSFNLERLPETIEEAHKRLARVQIECLPYEAILTQFDRPTTLFYLDPPYYGRKLYNYNFEPEDFATLADQVKPLQGKFVLSLNDVPEVSANQYLGQYPDEMRAAILSVGTHVFFQLSPGDAATIAQALDGGKSLAERLKNLRHRHFVVKSGADHWQEGCTPTVHDPQTDVEGLLSRARAHHGRPRAEVEAEIAERQAALMRTTDEALHGWE
jgi:DNA adenine methylase